jgi:hypothetical protein
MRAVKLKTYLGIAMGKRVENVKNNPHEQLGRQPTDTRTAGPPPQSITWNTKSSKRKLTKQPVA